MEKSTNWRKDGMWIGMAGVYAVASKLCLRGQTPCFPAVDVGVDLVLDNGVKLQVKAGNFRTHPAYPNGVYCIDAIRSLRVVKGRRVYGERSYKGTCDFLIFWAIPENRFFVIPVGELSKAVWLPTKQGLAASPRKPKKESVARILAYEDAWHLLDVESAVQGMEQQLTSVEVKEI